MGRDEELDGLRDRVDALEGRLAAWERFAEILIGQKAPSLKRFMPARPSDGTAQDAIPGKERWVEVGGIRVLAAPGEEFEEAQMFRDALGPDAPPWPDDEPIS